MNGSSFELCTLWELNGSSFEQTWIPFTQRCVVPSLVEIGPVVLEKKIFLNFVNVCLLFRNYLPLEKSMWCKKNYSVAELLHTFLNCGGSEFNVETFYYLGHLGTYLLMTILITVHPEGNNSSFISSWKVSKTFPRNSWNKKISLYMNINAWPDRSAWFQLG